MVAGVARGLADHLRVPVWGVRLVFLGLVLVAGAGVVIYGALWIVVPVGTDRRAEGVGGTSLLLASVAAVAVGIVLLLQFFGGVPGSALPIVLVLLGATVVWLRSDDEQRQRFARRATGAEQPGRVRWLPLGLGALLILTGTIGFLVAQGSLVDGARVMLAGLVVAVGIGLLAAPWLIAVWRERDEERRARIRSQERAEIAAHVHDSVLQTLTLIQRNADEAPTVNRLARAQERDLRRWLYEPAPAASDTLRGALGALVGEVEDVHGVPIELVCVSDVPVDDRLHALVLATREAIVNAAKYGGLPGPISVYAEVSDGEVAVFVRDRGPGFDLSSVPDDRRGIKESIVGRLERNGGSAVIKRLDDAGTQVEMRMKVNR